MEKVVGHIIFLFSANILAFRLGIAKNKEATKVAWWNIGTFVAGILVGILHFHWIEF